MNASPAQPFDDAALDAYVADAVAWRSRLSGELLELDEQTKLAGIPDTGDVTLAFALWRAASVRIDEIVVARGQGRIDRAEREAASAAVWAMVLGDDGTPLAANFPELRTLLDALVERLRGAAGARTQQLAQAAGLLAPITERVAAASARAAQLGEMVHQVQAIAERLRKLRPTDDPQALAASVAELDGDLSPIERDLATLASSQASLTADASALTTRLAAATELEHHTRAIAAECQEKVTAPPHLAVPSVATLGSPPSSDEIAAVPWREGRSLVDAFDAKLSRVERALATANEAYSAPVRRRDELRGLLDGYRAMAASRRLDEQPDASAAYDTAKRALWTAPCDLDAAATLVTAYQQIVNRTAPRGAVEDRR
jgi:hypothetical protein